MKSTRCARSGTCAHTGTEATFELATFENMPRSYPLNVVGRQVAKIRSDRHLSQTELAAVCQLGGWDITRDTIAKIEGGLRWVGDLELIYLARALKVTVAELFPADPDYQGLF